MSLTDEDFADLVRAYSQNRESSYLRRTLADAADTTERVMALADLLSTQSAVSQVEPNSVGDDERAQVATNVVEFATGNPMPPTSPEVTGLGDVGGLEEVKTQLKRRMIDPLAHPEIFKRFKRRAGGGLLLYGPPGCGKTLVVKALAAEARIRLVTVEAAEILDSAVGYSEKRLVASFDEARAAKPSILFFDEVEALGSRRSHGSDFKSSLVSTFLSSFDGMSARNDKVLVVGATNVPWAVDSAFRRPGRFDRTLFVPPPNRAARTAILQRLLVERPVELTVNAEEIAQFTSGFSGADLTNLVETAIDLAIEDNLVANPGQMIGMKHFERARREVRSTTSEWLTTARNYAKYANEAGHYDEVLQFLDKNAA